MGNSREQQIIKDLDYRRQGMDREYNSWEAHFKLLRDNIMPTRGLYSLGESKSDATVNMKIIDSAGKLALRTLKSGMMAGMTSPSRPWFKLGPQNDEYMDDPEVKNYFHVVEKRMYHVMRGSNIYRTFAQCYADLGLFGTFGGMIHGDFENVITTRGYPMGMFRIAEDENGIVDSLHWDLRWTVAKTVKRFGLEKCSTEVQNDYKRNDLNNYVDICAAVEIRRDRDPMSPLATDKPMAAYYWEKGKTDQLLLNSGHGINGILAPRWEREEGGAWSVSSPGMDALGDCVQLQGQQRDKAKAVKLSYDPPMQAAAGFKKRYRNVPGGITTMTTNDLQKGGMRPAHDVRVDLQHLTADINETRQRIDAAMYADLFRMASQLGIEGLKNVTATGIAEMHEEKLLQLGPVLDSVSEGIQTPSVEATFHYMQEAEILPPAPDVIANSPVKVEFISLFAQAQKSVGISAIERTVGFAGSLEQVLPGSNAADNIDADVAMREFSNQVGPPPLIVRDAKEVQRIRAERAQAQQAAAAMENAQPMAQAANLISEANERGAAGLQRGAF